MEAIITVVGFLGSGKTTLLKHLADRFMAKDWSPFVILNDYENAYIDAQQFITDMGPKRVRPLRGNCVSCSGACCSGINDLQNCVNSIPEREKGITLIEANGTTDAVTLMSFLGVGLNERFLPPIQVSVVDVKNWQQRGEHNALEANQIQVSSIIVLTHTDDVSEERQKKVASEVKNHNPLAKILTIEEIDTELLPHIEPSRNEAQKLNQLKTYWSSCSVDIPALPHKDSINAICNALPKGVLRVKGCAKIEGDTSYTFFERTPDGTVTTRPFKGKPLGGTQLVTIGPGSDISLTKDAITLGIEASKSLAPY
jgi:G3E family GTPase